MLKPAVMIRNWLKKSRSMGNNCLSLQTGAETRQLLVLDFDLTVCDANADLEIQSLVADGIIPADLRALCARNRGGVDFMNAVFELLHAQGVTEHVMKSLLQHLPLAPGMSRLLDVAGFDANTDVIIISDSNAQFIEWILESRGQRTAVNAIFANSCQIDQNGRFRVQSYHEQTTCKCCPSNLCKGRIMDEFIRKKRADNINYERVVYMGDGKTDVCAASRMKQSDVLCIRRAFQLAAMFESMTLPLKCRTRFYTSAVEILNSELHLKMEAERITVASYVTCQE